MASSPSARRFWGRTSEDAHLWLHVCKGSVPPVGGGTRVTHVPEHDRRVGRCFRGTSGFQAKPENSQQAPDLAPTPRDGPPHPVPSRPRGRLGLRPSCPRLPPATCVLRVGLSWAALPVSPPSASRAGTGQAPMVAGPPRTPPALDSPPGRRALLWTRFSASPCKQPSSRVSRPHTLCPVPPTPKEGPCATGEGGGGLAEPGPPPPAAHLPGSCHPGAYMTAKPPPESGCLASRRVAGSGAVPPYGPSFRPPETGLCPPGSFTRRPRRPGPTSLPESLESRGQGGGQPQSVSAKATP